MERSDRMGRNWKVQCNLYHLVENQLIVKSEVGGQMAPSEADSNSNSNNHMYTHSYYKQVMGSELGIKHKQHGVLEGTGVEKGTLTIE